MPGEAIREHPPRETPAEATQRAEATAAEAGFPLVIDAKGMQKSFGENVVLRDMSLRVRPGEIFGLIGPSGSGKSTTVHLLCGHLRPSEGTASVLGEEPASFTRKTRRRIGYMPQGFILNPDLSVRDNLAFAAGLYGVGWWRARTRIRAMLALTELGDARKRRARDLSGGMQRRLALAAALVHDPDLLFADEPTANLDPILRAKLWEYFRWMSERGRTLLITTQYIDEAENCDRVGLMFDGALIAEGKPEELRRTAFGGDIVDIMLEQPSPEYLRAAASVPGVLDARASWDGALRVTVEDAERATPLLLSALEERGATATTVAHYRPTFDEVFIRLIEQHGRSTPPMGGLRRMQTG